MNTHKQMFTPVFQKHFMFLFDIYTCKSSITIIPETHFYLSFEKEKKEKTITS